MKIKVKDFAQVLSAGVYLRVYVKIGADSKGPARLEDAGAPYVHEAVSQWREYELVGAIPLSTNMKGWSCILHRLPERRRPCDYASERHLRPRPKTG